MSDPATTSSQRLKIRTRHHRNCIFCGLRVKVVKMPLIYKNTLLGNFSVEKCDSCGEIVFPPSAWNAIKKFDRTMNHTFNTTLHPDTSLTSHFIDLILQKGGTVISIGQGTAANYSAINANNLTVRPEVARPVLVTSTI